MDCFYRFTLFPSSPAVSRRLELKSADNRIKIYRCRRKRGKRRAARRPGGRIIVRQKKPAVSFGLHRMLDYLRLGGRPLVVVLLLKIFGESIASYKKIFLLTAVPAPLLFLYSRFFVRETVN